MPATPAMPMQENSSLRKTFSMSRCEIMLPGRGPPVTGHDHAAVECGGDDRGAVRQFPGQAARHAHAAGPGSSSGAAEVRNSLNEEVPALR